MTKVNTVKNKKTRFAKVEIFEQLQKILETNKHVALHYFYGKNDNSPLRNEEVRKLLDEKNVTCVEIDVSLKPEIVARMGVKAFPVTVFYNGGKMVVTQNGNLHSTAWNRHVERAFS
jgi:hypothetical protein